MVVSQVEILLQGLNFCKLYSQRRVKMRYRLLVHYYINLSFKGNDMIEVTTDIKEGLETKNGLSKFRKLIRTNLQNKDFTPVDSVFQNREGFHVEVIQVTQLG